MTKVDKEVLLNFITRIGMYIHPVEANTAISFIHGYEAGTENKCDFTKQVRQILMDKYKVDYRSDGWPGQIRRLAKKQHSTWLITFKKTTLEIIANAEGGSLNETQLEILKKKIKTGLLDRINPAGHPWFSADWVAEWQSLCAVKSVWFKQLWTRQEWPIIRAIDKLVQANSLFQDEEQRLPSLAILQLKDRYIRVAKANEELPEAH